MSGIQLNNTRNAKKLENMTTNQESSINRKRCRNETDDENNKDTKTPTIKSSICSKVRGKHDNDEEKNGRYTK